MLNADNLSWNIVQPFNSFIILLLVTIKLRNKVLQASFCLKQVLLYRGQAWSKDYCTRAKPGNTPSPWIQSNKIQNDFNQSERSMRSTDPEASHEKRDTKT